MGGKGYVRAGIRRLPRSVAPTSLHYSNGEHEILSTRKIGNWGLPEVLASQLMA